MNWWPIWPISQLNRIESKLDQLITKETQTVTAVDDLTAAVAAENTVIDSAITLLNQLTAAISAANAISPAAVEAVVTDIQTKTSALSAAVAANTPAAPAAPTTPTSTTTVPADTTTPPATPPST